MGYDRTKNLKPAKKGEVRNPKGRPKKLLTEFLDDLKDEGFGKVTKTQAEEAYEALLGLPLVKLIEISQSQGNDYPAILVIASRHLLDRKGKAFQVLEAMLDRAHGKPKQTTDENVNLNLNNLPQLKWADDSEQ